MSDTEVNEALESGDLEKGVVDFDEVEHDEGRRSPGPQADDSRRTPDQGVATDQSGDPVEPPD